MVEAINAIADRCYVFSLDIPSGLNGATGKASPVAVRAQATVTFEAAKTGLMAAEATPYVGKLLVRGIGIPRIVRATHPCRASRMLDTEEIQYDSNTCKVSVIGVGMRSHSGVASKMFSVLKNENINILMISTSEIKITCLIEEKYVELAVRALHDAFELSKGPARAC